MNPDETEEIIVSPNPDMDAHDDTKNKVYDVEKAEDLKLEGNQAYGQKDYLSSLNLYLAALELVPADSKEASVYHANCAACHLAIGHYNDAIQDCTNAIAIDGSYVKALLRRCTAYEALDDLEKALNDAKKALELNENPSTRKIVQRLEPLVLKKQEDMKNEMIGKLKDMGNAVLGKFGMSLDNFVAEKNPETGGYNINMKK